MGVNGAFLGVLLSALLLGCTAQPASQLSVEDVRVIHADASAPLQGSAVEGVVFIVVRPDAQVQQVDFYLDSQGAGAEPIATSVSRPFGLELDTRELEAGTHTLRVIARLGSSDADFREVEVVVEFSVNPDISEEPVPREPEDTYRELGSLRGNPAFQDADLPTSARVWYQRFVNGLHNPAANLDIYELARTGNLYNIGRTINENITVAISAFRITGDLRLLDYIDSVMQVAREQLADTNEDGYLNWVELHDRVFYGTDLHALDESMAHSYIPELAWLYESNRDLRSPSGVDYAERADFWTDYVENHFEAKWRERNRVGAGNADFLPYYMLHTYVEFTRYYWYMYRLTGQQSYYDEALRRARVIAANLVEVSTDYGPAYVYPWGVVTEGNKEDGLMAVTYGRYVVQSIADLYRDGFPGFTEHDLELFATGARALIIKGNNRYAETVGGDGSIGGLDIGYTEGEKDNLFWSYTSYAPALVEFDSTGYVAEHSEVVNRAVESNVEMPKRVFLSAAIFFDKMTR